jgi:hypothetical protein
MEWEPKVFGRPPAWQVAPTQFVMAVSGAHLAKAEIRHEGTKGWVPLQLREIEDSFVMKAHIESRFPLTSIQLRFFIDISQEAGFGACELTSPAVVEYPGNDKAMEQALGAGLTYIERNKATGVTPFVPHSALIWMSVPGLHPDRASLDAEGQIRREQVLLSCISDAPEPMGQEKLDPYYYSRTLLTQSSCGSVQTFRDPGASGSLNRRVFFAGILISIGLALLIEALITGFTEERRKRPQPS